MATMNELLQERTQIDSKIRSLRVIKSNRMVALLLSSGSLQGRQLEIHNNLHKELTKGIPSQNEVDDILDQLEAALDI